MKHLNRGKKTQKKIKSTNVIYKLINNFLYKLSTSNIFNTYSNNSQLLKLGIR
jgi:hypothetical protein